MKSVLIFLFVIASVCSCTDEIMHKSEENDAVLSEANNDTLKPSKQGEAKSKSRKIIYKANMDLVIDDFKVFEKDLNAKINELSSSSKPLRGSSL